MRYAALSAKLLAWEQAGLKRQVRPLVPISATEAMLDGRRMTLFCTNDYLGLSQHPEVKAAFARGAGAGASRLISGDRPAHHALEEAIGENFGRPATLFNSGYAANVALPAVLMDIHQTIGSDQFVHASMVDGIRLSKAQKIILPHNQPPPSRVDLLMLEGLYSMDGDYPDYTRYSREPWWLVDEAHAVGCLGPGGRGTAAAAGIEPDFIVGTLGKAYGAAGAFVVGPPVLRELLISRARSLVYSTAIPENVAWAALAGLKLADNERRERLMARVTEFRGLLHQLGIPALGSAHIIPILTGECTMQIAEALQDQGFLVPGIRYPTVPRGQERIRITLCSEHTPEQLSRLAEALQQSLPSRQSQPITSDTAGLPPRA